VRGTELLRARLEEGRRFIPARAGNSFFQVLDHCIPPVHPRTCGEQLFRPTSCGDDHGSSPHVRGTVFLLPLHYANSRFIPARAGNRSPRTDRHTGTPVHPRTCGEQVPITRPASQTVGSSPHVRGTGSPAGYALALERFIPARAGNSALVP